MDEAGPKVIVYGDGEPARDVVLDAVEARVLGALVEKQVTTPDYYPLTLNALVNACNQTSSRDPVVSYDETTVLRALDRLRDQKLASVSAGAESRVAKYRHKLTERFELAPAEVAAFCLLLLRGPQTIGELRNRSGRLHEFASLPEVEETLNALAARQPQPLVAKLPRQPGTKESRFTHLLSGPLAAAPADSPASTQSIPSTPSDADRLARLEQEVADLKQQFATFRKQFE